MPRASSNREGFALPMAILVIALVTVGLMASFSTTRSEIGNISSQRAQARAYSIAQSGLEAFLARRNEAGFCAPPNGNCTTQNGIGGGSFPTQRETLFVKMEGGLAIIRATPVQINLVAGSGTYLITSTGYDSSSAVYSGSKARLATRTVGLFATYTRSTMNVISGWTSLSGIDINGNSAVISGINTCDTASAPSVAGLSVPFDPVTGKADMSRNNNWNPTGNPPFDTTKTFAQESAAVKIDWAGIKSGNKMPADITIPGGTFPSAATFAADTNYFPVIHVTQAGLFALPNAGRGTIIVDNNMSISGSNQWSGIILVGGTITSNGNNVSAGATVSGLNYLTGSRPGNSVTSAADDATANGTKQYVYNSCSVARATTAQAKYYVISNSWMDNLAGY